MKKTLRENLTDWTDWDIAEYYLAVALGIMPTEEGDGEIFRLKAKHVFWTDNPVGVFLGGVLGELAELGVLDHDDEEERFRWNPGYGGSWE
jgi:hypothetical protein